MIFTSTTNNKLFWFLSNRILDLINDKNCNYGGSTTFIFLANHHIGAYRCRRKNLPILDDENGGRGESREMQKLTAVTFVAR